MATTLPVSCFTLEDSLKLLHAKRTQKPLLPAEETLDSGFKISRSYLGLKFLLTAVKIIIILPSMLDTHHLNPANFPFPVLVFLQPGAELL